MCGIFGYVGKRRDAAQLVFEGLKSLEYRGYDSWGIGVVPLKNPGLSTKIIVKKKVGKIGKSTVDDMPSSSFAFGHTRWATHGGVTKTNAHPHLNGRQNIALVHNGIIDNYQKLKQALLKKGYRFVSETDTEVALHLVEDLAKKMSFPAAVRRTFKQLQGLNAIIVINTKDNTLFAIRNGSPLVIGFGKGENYLASDATAIGPHTKEICYLGDDQMAVVSVDRVKLFSLKSGIEVKPKKQKIDWQIEEAEKGKFPYFMIKEINEQPKVLLNILNNFDNDIRKLANKLKKAKDIIFVGCGTASYAGMTGKYLLSIIAGLKSEAISGSEFAYSEKHITRESFPLFLSQSGETIDIVQSASQLKKKNIKIGALVNRLGSTLYRLADTRILLGAGPEICVLSTKVFTAKLAILMLSAYCIRRKYSQGKRNLQAAINQVKTITSDSYYRRYISKLVGKLKGKKSIYVIGRGLSYPIGLEAALKIKEVSYIHAEGFAGGELKHGMIALIEKGTPCIAYAPNDETYLDVISNATEVKARGGFIIGISHKNHEIFDWYIPVRDCKEATVIPNVVVVQLLSYYLAVALGYDPDKPRNLAKSVTVK